jgi:hypothetical protein
MVMKGLRVQAGSTRRYFSGAMYAWNIANKGPHVSYYIQHIFICLSLIFF